MSGEPRLLVRQVRGMAGRPWTQRLVLKGLGLRGPGSEVVVDNARAIRGMIRKVLHMVSVAEVADSAASAAPVRKAAAAKAPAGGSPAAKAPSAPKVAKAAAAKAPAAKSTTMKAGAEKAKASAGTPKKVKS
jgi:large subunit ribosomal protein L30